MNASFLGTRCNSIEGNQNIKHENTTVGPIHMPGLSGNYTAILNISRTGRVALM